MTSLCFEKNKIVDIVDFLTQYDYELVYYQFIRVTSDLYQIRFFGLHKEDQKKLEYAINFRFC